jgi:hypothetical protein
MIETMASLTKVSPKLDFAKLYFERLLPNYTLNTDLWTLYLSITLELCKDQSERMAIHIRALKNIYSSSEFWSSYALEQEQQGVTADEVRASLD